MNPVKQANPGITSDQASQEAFRTYQKDFRSALDRSAQALQEAIAQAQQSIAGQLTSLGPSLTSPPGSDLQSASIKALTEDIVDAAFARAREIVEQVERTSTESQSIPFAPEKLPTQPGAPQESIPNDPMEATNSLVSQSTQWMTSAMEKVLQNMPAQTSGATDAVNPVAAATPPVFVLPVDPFNPKGAERG